MNSGTAALHAALMALGIGPGDEVIVPAFTFFATASSVCMCGATPVFVDVDPDTFNISVDAVAEAVTQRTTAVIGVHLLGNHSMCSQRSRSAMNGVSPSLKTPHRPTVQSTMEKDRKHGYCRMFLVLSDEEHDNR